MNEKDSQPGEQSPPKLGPGDRLQAARISIGMTVEEVAAKMHLSTGILTSLEDNNFEDITAPIFVKGYLRAYSRLVNINEDEIIQQYLTYYMNGDPPISSTSNTSPEINSDDSKVKWITYIVIIVLIALLSTWWWNRYQQAPETVSLESGENFQSEVVSLDVPVATPEPVQQNTQTLTSEAEKESLQLEIKSVVDSLDLQQKQTEELNVASAELENVVEPSISQPSVDTVEILTVSIDDSTNNVETEEPVVPDEASAVIETPVPDNNLVISVNADTWASIKDANGNKLVYDLLRSGETISVTGKAPISAFLGNGYGVTMKYKGKDVDLSSVIKSDNTARIKIGQ